MDLCQIRLLLCSSLTYSTHPLLILLELVTLYFEAKAHIVVNGSSTR